MSLSLHWNMLIFFFLLLSPPFLVKTIGTVISGYVVMFDMFQNLWFLHGSEGRPPQPTIRNKTLSRLTED